MPFKKKAAKRTASVKKKPNLVKKKPLPLKKTLKKAAPRRAAKPKTPKKLIIGKITHYFPHVNAAVVKVKAPLKIGDIIKIKGHTTNLSETVSSMQIDRVPIQIAKKGQEIGLLVSCRVRRGDTIYKI